MINATAKVKFVPTIAHGVPVWAVVGLGRTVRLTKPLQVIDNYQLPAGELGQLQGIEYQEGKALAMVQFHDRLGSYEGVEFDQVQLV